jgi:DNA primase
VVSLHLSGIENVVASSGTSLTEGQIKLIKRFTDNVTVLYDGDAAGIKASLRGIDMLLEGGLNVKAVVFPDGDDPDSYSRKVGSEAFQTYLSEHARDFIEFKIDLYTQESKGDPIKRAEVVRQVVQSIAKIPDPIIRTIYVKESGRLLEIEEDIVLTELNKILLKSDRDAAFKAMREQEANAVDIPFEELLPVAKPEVSKTQSLEDQERETVRLLISYGFEKVSDELHVCEYLLQEIAELNFETPVFQKILVRYKKALNEGILPNPDYFMQTPDAEVKSQIVSMISQKHELSESWEKKHQIFTNRESDNLSKTVYDSVLRLKRRVLSKMIDETKMKIKIANEEELGELLQVYQELKRFQGEIDKHFGTVISN